MALSLQWYRTIDTCSAAACHCHMGDSLSRNALCLASLQTVILILALVFFGGVLIFSLMAVFVVWAVNQTARTVQQGTFRTATQPESVGPSQEPDAP